jgi:hypothetical protein
MTMWEFLDKNPWWGLAYLILFLISVVVIVAGISASISNRKPRVIQQRADHYQLPED